MAEQQAQIAVLDRYAFKARPAADDLPDQLNALGTYIDAFIAEQQGKCNDGRTFSQWLDAIIGDEADSACEVLAFGFAVENRSMGVYRLWSRLWLCSK